MDMLDFDPIGLWIDTISVEEATAQVFSTIVFPDSPDAPDAAMTPQLSIKLDDIPMSDIYDNIVNEATHQSLQRQNEPTRKQCSNRSKRKAVTTTTTVSSVTQPATTSRKCKHSGDQMNNNRKTRQREYERGYRGRCKEKRGQTKAQWLNLEREIRLLLAEKAPKCVKTVVVSGNADKGEDKSQVLLELLHEAQGHNQDIAFFKCIKTWSVVLDTWGAETPTGCSIRAQINSLPTPRRMFSFDW